MNKSVCLWALLCALFISQTLFSQFSFSQSPGVSAPGESFSPVLFESGQGEVPQVGEWTRTAGPDESIVFTGHRLSSFSGVEEGKDSRFMVYGTGGVKKEGKIQRLDGQKAIVTLDHALPSWSMYLLQPGNDAGWGKAVAINKTEAWWAQNKVAAGMISSLYGRNLAHGNVEGTSNSHVYIKALGSGSGQWAEVVKVNPYKIEYRVPSSVGEGQYELWVHNGHGGEWGWSAPVVVTVVQSAEHIQTKVWSGATINVKDYGARGDGQGDDRTAINAALLAAGSSGATLYFPSGTYMVSGQLNLRSNTRWLGEVNGEGKPTSMIKLRGGFASGEFGLMGGSDVNLVLFKNIAIDRNYQNLGGHELMDFRSGSMLWWDNCELEVREETALRLAGSSRHIYITATTITGGKDQWGSPLFLDGVRQFFFSGSTIRMTKDCGAAINNKAVVEASMENCLVKDLDNSTTDGSGWGKGRIWSHVGAGGAAYHCYFSANTGTGLGVRQSGSNLPDQNSGEVFLWEANGTMYSGVPSSSSASTISFGGSSIPQDRGELCLAVIKGKGLGQFRRIVSNSGGVLTLDRPWEVQPDGSSMVVVGPYVEKIVLYKNQLDAKGKTYGGNDDATASAGIEPYGGCFDFVADGNTIEGLRKGLSTWAMEHGVAIDPTYFCLYTNNKMIGCAKAIHNAAAISNDQGGPGLLGLTYRRNIIQNPLLSGVYNDIKQENFVSFSAIVYEYNTATNAPLGFTTGRLGTPDPRVDYGAGAMENQIFYKNNFQGGDRGIKITPKIMLRENLYQGLSSPYHGSLPSVAMVEAPYHVVEIMAKPGEEVVKTPFTLVNAGTTPMTWTASSSAEWLSVPMLGISINGEAKNSNIELTATPKGLSAGTHKAYLTISTSLAHKEVYTILLQIGNSPSQPIEPSISITSPTTGSTFTSPATVTLTADASDKDGSISKVEFFNGTSKLGEDLTAPYSFQWDNVAQGSHNLTAKATDNSGLTAISQEVNIIVPTSVSVPSQPIAQAVVAPAAPSPGCSNVGKISWEYWTNVEWTGSLYVPENRQPTETRELSSFSTPVTIDDYYAARLRGYICPPETGLYTFYLAADNLGGLWLSPNENPGDKQKIAGVDSWTSSNEFEKYATQKSKTIYLEAGKRYYVEALYIEEFGGDHLSVAWQTPSGKTEKPIDGSHLIPYTSVSVPSQPIAQAVVAPAAPSPGCSNVGKISWEYWTNVEWTGSLYVPENRQPTETRELSSFSTPVTIDDYYAARLRGYICPPETGLYTFYLAADNLGGLWLSPNENPGDKQKIAGVDSWTSSNEFEKYATQKSKTIYLEAGKRYYVEALYIEEFGGDHLSVAWQTPSGKTEKPIDGSHLIPYTSVSVPSQPIAQAVVAPAAPSPGCSNVGKISWEYWTNVEWTGSLYVPENRQPTETRELSSFSTPVTIDDYYAARLRGYICPPETGLYTFYLAADNLGGLWLSPNENPGDKQKIAGVDSWTSSNEFEKYATQKSKTIYLEAGKRYYVEALYIEEFGGDHLSVAWQTPSGKTEKPIDGSHLIPYTSVSKASRLATDLDIQHAPPTTSTIVPAADRLTIYPNPFREQATIEFSLAESANVSLQVFNQQGALVKTIYKGNINAGALTRFTFNSNNLVSGVYLCRLVSGKKTLQQKMVLLK